MKTDKEKQEAYDKFLEERTMNIRVFTQVGLTQEQAEAIVYWTQSNFIKRK